MQKCYTAYFISSKIVFIPFRLHSYFRQDLGSFASNFSSACLTEIYFYTNLLIY